MFTLPSGSRFRFPSGGSSATLPGIIFHGTSSATRRRLGKGHHGKIEPILRREISDAIESSNTHEETPNTECAGLPRDPAPYRAHPGIAGRGTPNPTATGQDRGRNRRRTDRRQGGARQDPGQDRMATLAETECALFIGYRAELHECGSVREKNGNVSVFFRGSSRASCTASPPCRTLSPRRLRRTRC